MKTRAAIAPAAGKPLEVVTVDLAGPKAVNADEITGMETSRVPWAFSRFETTAGIADRIWWLVADGLPNPAIARRLYLSRPTVASHVAHILTKLGFASRAQIAAWVAGQSRADPA